MLARAGLEVDLGTRTREQAETLAATGRNDRYLPGVELPDGVHVLRAAELELSRHDLVCFAVPAGALPAAVAAHASHIPSRAGVLVLSKGMVPPLGTLPAAYVAERTDSWSVGVLGGPAHAAAALHGGASLVFASADPAFRRQVTDALGAAGFDAAASADVIGVELAGCAKNAAALAAATAAHAGPNAAGSAAGKVFAEVEAYARAAGARPGTFAGPRRRRRPRRHGARERVAQPARRGAALPGRGRRRHRARPGPDGRGACTASRCSPGACARPASTRPCCAGWRT